MGKLTTSILAASLALAATHLSAAQPGPARGGSARRSKAPAAPPPPISIKIDPNESRFHLGDADAFIQELSSRFAIRSRTTDPFGLPQDPNVQPQKPKVVAAKTSKYQNIAATPFADIVRAIRINGVMPAKGRFLVGSRSIKVGDSFPLAYRDKQIPIRVVKVSSTAIVFANLQTKETASLTVDLMPPGMHRGDKALDPPGLARDNPTAPLEVEVAGSNTPSGMSPPIATPGVSPTRH